MKKVFYSLIGVLLLIAADALSKGFALQLIPPLSGTTYPFGGIGLFENVFNTSFSLNTAVNTGAAWGLFPSHPYWLLAARIAIIAALFVYLIVFRSGEKSKFPLWLIIAGALGNVADMLYYGHVIDFFHVCIAGWSFPIFNLADTFITIGVALLLLQRQKKSLLQSI